MWYVCDVWCECACGEVCGAVCGVVWTCVCVSVDVVWMCGCGVVWMCVCVCVDVVFMCVCGVVWMCVCVCGVCGEVKGLCWVLFLSHLPLYFWRQGLSLNLVLSDLAILTGQEDQKILLSLPPNAGIAGTWHQT